MGKARAKQWQLERAKQRRLLRLAFTIMEVMFLVELGFGIMTISAALQVDALETASSKPMTDAVLERKISVRSEILIELAGGVMAMALCAWVIGVMAWNLKYHLTPDPAIMGFVSIVGITANTAVALFLYKRRLSSSTLRAAWATSRNDVIGNIAVLAAAFGVYATGDAWPDALAAAIILPFALNRAVTAIRLAQVRLRALRKITQGGL